MTPKSFARFWSKVRIGEPHECWLYTGGLDPDGYGIFYDEDRRPVRSNRYAFRCANGRDPTNMALHKCSNPTCCNPVHIYDGTASENTRDSILAGTYVSVFVAGENHPNAKLTNAQVSDALRMVSLGQSKRSVARHFGVDPMTIHYHVKKQRAAS